MKELLIFDLDGLLLDTEKIYFDGWLALFEEHQIPLTAEDISGWRGQSWKQTADQLAQVVGGHDHVQTLRAEREGFIETQMTNGTLQMKPYAKETIDFAREKGFKLALATSTMKERAAKLLPHFDLLDVFDYMTFGDDVAAHKPDPAPYLLTLDKAGKIADQALVMEDSLLGALAATRAGIEVVLIPDQSFPQTYTKADKAQLNLFAETDSLRFVYELLQTDQLT